MQVQLDSWNRPTGTPTKEAFPPSTLDEGEFSNLVEYCFGCGWSARSRAPQSASKLAGRPRRRFENTAWRNHGSGSRNSTGADFLRSLRLSTSTAKENAMAK